MRKALFLFIFNMQIIFSNNGQNLPTIIINFHTNQNNNNDNNFQPTITSVTSVDAIGSNENKIQAIQTKPYNYFNKNNKKHLLLLFCISYSYCCFLKIRSKLLISKKNSLMNFKPDLTFNELNDLSSIELAQLILKNSDKKNNFNLYEIMKNIDYEIKLLKDYLNLCKILNNLKLSWIYPVNNLLIEKSNIKLERLNLLKRLLLPLFSV